MILTGPEIRAQVEDGRFAEAGFGPSTSMRHIHVDPYDPELVGPNSIDLRLGDSLLVYEPLTTNGFNPERFEPLDMRKENPTIEVGIPDDGLVLEPGVLYLGRTIECIGSNAFVPIVEGRSSVGRLGIHVHVTAGFCDLGFKGTITLEIHVIHPVRVYPGVAICQAYFLEPRGEIELYKGRYQGQVEPTASRFSQKKNGDE